VKSVVIHDDTPSLYINNCELYMGNYETNVNLGAAGVAGATYFLFCQYTRARGLTCLSPLMI
jgi:hypothetical protein